MKVYVLLYDNGDDCVDQLFGIYENKESAELDIIPYAKKIGDNNSYSQYVKYFRVEEMPVN